MKRKQSLIGGLDRQLLDKGVDIPTIAFFLGHKFLGSSLTYLHSTKEHLEGVIAKLER